MLGELARANGAVDKAIAEFRMNEAANTLYEFIWGVVCDWYVELSKPTLQGEDGPDKDETRAVTAFVLRETAKLLHPVMPFITEELWDKLGHRAEHGALIGQPWPVPAPADAAADAEIGWLIKLISDIRSARAELNVPAGAKLKLLVVGCLLALAPGALQRVLRRRSAHDADRPDDAQATRGSELARSGGAPGTAARHHPRRSAGPSHRSSGRSAGCGWRP
jgi:valyl-tRNA synthetase